MVALSNNFQLILQGVFPLLAPLVEAWLLLPLCGKIMSQQVMKLPIFPYFSKAE